MRQLGATTTCKPTFWMFVEAAVVGNAVAIGASYLLRAATKTSSSEALRTHAPRIAAMAGFWIGGGVTWALLARSTPACPSAS